ncbi:MAG: hypothetical protein J0652_08325 [Desulfobulbaceae bacterium]|jgi:hypothetical protein|nr:hypothetical protein [Desulfobulbaceae bacterium]
MKKLIPMVLTAAVLSMPCALFAQQETTVVRTTTSTENMGTISEVGPDNIIIQSQTSTTPLRYNSTKSTTYVDENGNPVSIETVRSGLPVTVYYTRDGDRMVADKVVVRKITTTTEKPMIHERTETKTRTIETETK